MSDNLYTKCLFLNDEVCLSIQCKIVAQNIVVVSGIQFNAFVIFLS